MNRKGFTLIEIIMCVVLIAVIGIVVGVNSDKIFGNDQNKDVTQTIISAAEVYASGNAKVIDEIYHGCGNPEKGCGFVTITIGELKEDGLLDESIVLVDEEGNPLPDTTPVLVTLNEDGYLEYTLNKDDMSQGYVATKTLTIAKGDDFKCYYYVGNPEGLTFNKKDGTNISSQMTYVSNITQDNQYTCEENIDSSTAPGTYTVKYHYQIDGVTKEIERQIVVLDEFNYDINRDNFVAQQHYLEETSANNYTLYTTNDTYDLTIDPDSTYVNKAIKIVYEKDGVKQISKTFSGLGVGTYTFKINVSDKEKVYGDTEELLAKTNFVTTKTFNLTIKKVPELTITNEVFKDEDNKVVLNTDWNTGKKISFTLNNEDIIVSRKYKLDTETEAKDFTGNSIPLITTPANKINITVTDKLGRTFSKDYDIKVDKLPTTSPTVTSGASTTYALSKTFRISLPTNTVSGSTYHYYLADSTPSATTTGTTFTSTSLTLNSRNINTDNVKYLYLKTCNAIGCSSWSQANAYLTKKVSEWTDSNCTVDSNNSSVCYYVGSKSNNYVSYGGKKWRIYKKTSGKLSLILDSSYTTAPYGQVGKCTSGCCNNGRYLYRYLGDTDRSSYSSYGFKGNTMGTTLSNFYNSLTSTSLLEYFTSGYANVQVGLLSRTDYMKVANCASDSSCSYATSNYIKSGKSAFWLVDYYSSHNGDYGDFNTDRTATAYNYSVNSSGKIVTSVGSTSISNVITTSTLSVRPIVQIKSTAKITGGTGTSSNPYTLG